MIVSGALLCLALNVYHEARGEPIPGQYAVALVTINRANRQDRKVCDEVFKPKQFSWTGGVSKVKGGWSIPGKLKPRDDQAWSLANRVAHVTLQGQMPDFMLGSTFFHTKQVKPTWRKDMQFVRQVGNHRFYALREQSRLTVALQ